MKVTETQAVEQDVVVDVVCDRCGCTCARGPGQFGPHYEYATLTASWGYWSQKDCDRWHCDLCESCADDFAEWAAAKGYNGVYVTDPLSGQAVRTARPSDHPRPARQGLLPPQARKGKRMDERRLNVASAGSAAAP